MYSLNFKIPIVLLNNSTKMFWTTMTDQRKTPQSTRGNQIFGGSLQTNFCQLGSTSLGLRSCGPQKGGVTGCACGCLFRNMKKRKEMIFS